MHPKEFVTIQHQHYSLDTREERDAARAAMIAADELSLPIRETHTPEFGPEFQITSRLFHAMQAEPEPVAEVTPATPACQSETCSALEETTPCPDSTDGTPQADEPAHTEPVQQDLALPQTPSDAPVSHETPAAPDLESPETST